MELKKAWAEVSVFVSLVDARLGKWLTGQHGVGLTEYWALVHLRDAPNHELRVNDLAEKIGLNQSSVTRLLGRLEAKGFALRDTCPDDARGVYAVVTPAGKELVAVIGGGVDSTLSELLDGVVQDFPGLSGEDIKSAFALLRGHIS